MDFSDLASVRPLLGVRPSTPLVALLFAVLPLSLPGSFPFVRRDCSKPRLVPGPVPGM